MSGNIESLRYKSNDNFAISEVADEKVIVPVSDSVDTLNNLFSLNETGMFIISRMMDGKSVGEIADELVEEYEIDRETAVGDVAVYANSIAEKGFFTLAE